MLVSLKVEIGEGEAGEDTSSEDHVRECALELPTWRTVGAGCTDYFPNAARMDVSPGLGERDSVTLVSTR